MQRAALLLATLGAGAATTCDLFEKGGTPCVAAHSTVRALFGAYKGALYQVKRADGQLFDVKVANGFAAAAAQDKFCAGSSCVFWKIYDQSGRGNHLTIGPPGGAHHEQDIPADAAADPLTVGGHKVYGLRMDPPSGYRCDNTSGVAVGDEAETMYAVFNGSHYNNRCCFDYGNAETDNRDDGAGTMEAVYFGSAKGGLNHGGAGKGPWIMADMENALWGADRVVSNEEPINHDFVTAFVKGDSTGGATPPSPTPTPPAKPGPAKMQANHDICPGSGDLRNFATQDASKCNEACYSNVMCTAFVMSGGKCYLKSCTGPIVASGGHTLYLLPASPGRGPKPGHWAIKGGDATAGALKTYWDGRRAPGYAPMKKQGAIILGIGGDNSDGAVGTFYEGVMTTGYSSNATDAAVQANIVAAAYGK